MQLHVVKPKITWLNWNMTWYKVHIVESSHIIKILTILSNMICDLFYVFLAHEK